MKTEEGQIEQEEGKENEQGEVEVKAEKGREGTMPTPQCFQIQLFKIFNFCRFSMFLFSGFSIQ